MCYKWVVYRKITASLSSQTVGSAAFPLLGSCERSWRWETNKQTCWYHTYTQSTKLLHYCSGLHTSEVPHTHNLQPNLHTNKWQNNTHLFEGHDLHSTQVTQTLGDLLQGQASQDQCCTCKVKQPALPWWQSNTTVIQINLSRQSNKKTNGTSSHSPERTNCWHMDQQLRDIHKTRDWKWETE